ncbi:hypothetical protein VNO80_22247 [Phaseolus coccineus]|uniref:Uncharacterized protein n=1 Tax=Phaseolus coccineus TaxID=3886 RepID=A0AAN9MA45_PHACN
MIIDLKWVTETGRTAKPSDNIDKMEAKSSVSRLDMEYMRKADSDKSSKMKMSHHLQVATPGSTHFLFDASFCRFAYIGRYSTSVKPF